MGSEGKPAIVSAACRAMATQFEFLLWGDEEAHLRAAARQALDEVQRIHYQLSLFEPDSDVAEINRRASAEPVRTDPRVLALIEWCRGIWQATSGAFDITIGALMSRSGFRGASVLAADAEYEVGMEHILTDIETGSIIFDCNGLQLDFGAVGKGYALDMAAEVLRECRIGGALLHGGTSSVLAIGPDPHEKPWRVAIRDPVRPGTPVAVVPMQDAALGVSAPHGRVLRQCDREVGHILDPATGLSASHHRIAAVAVPFTTNVMLPAATADAYSTALLVRGSALLEDLHELGFQAWLA